MWYREICLCIVAKKIYEDEGDCKPEHFRQRWRLRQKKTRPLETITPKIYKNWNDKHNITKLFNIYIHNSLFYLFFCDFIKYWFLLNFEHINIVVCNPSNDHFKVVLKFINFISTMWRKILNLNSLRNLIFRHGKYIKKFILYAYISFFI